MSNSDLETVLVTGGSGLVGKAIKHEVEHNAALSNVFKFVFVSSKDADLTDFKQTASLFKLHKPDYVINLAARVGGLYANMNENQSFHSINMTINSNVLHWAAESKVKKCLSCLSTCIFPSNITYPLDESKIHQGPPHDSNYGYSLAKRQVDILNRGYNQVLNGDSLFTAIIPTNIYGRYDNFNLEQSHVIPNLIHKAYLSATEVNSKASGEAKLLVCGTGKPLRQFLFASDLAKVILWTLANYEDKEPLIISPDETEEVSIGYIADEIVACFSRKFVIKMKVEYDATQSDGQYKKTASNRKFRLLCPDFEFTPIETGIQETIDWFCSNYDDARK